MRVSLVAGARPGRLCVFCRNEANFIQQYQSSRIERRVITVAGIARQFIEHFDPAKECCWSAERDDAVIGSVVLAKKDETTARLSLFLVEPSARGFGKDLVGET